MSFDLLVFDPSLVPAEDKEFEGWYKSLVRWDHPESNFDLKICSPPLQAFFESLERSFPAMDCADTGELNPGNEASSLARLISRLLRWKWQSKNASVLPEDFDEARFTDYSFRRDAIYICFSWTVSEQALRATIDAALKANVGFYNVSGKVAHPIRRRKDLISLKNQIVPTSRPKFTDRDLFDILKKGGWSVTRDPVDGSRSATLVEEDKVFRLFPYINNNSEGTCIDWGESVVPLRYLDAICKIDGRPHIFYRLTSRNGTRLKRRSLTPEIVKGELFQIVAKLREVDLTAALNETANLPLSSPGNAPLRLLAAKACRGEYSQLCDMRDKMKSGQRQGFVPYIKTEHLERAVEACVQLNEDLS